MGGVVVFHAWKATWMVVVLAAVGPHGAALANQTSPSFDCAAAESEATELICKDPALAALDRHLRAVYDAAAAKAKALEADAKGAFDTLRATQRGWIKGRDDCWKAEDLRACVEDAYLRRDGELTATWILEEPTSVTSYMCGGNPANEVTVFTFATQRPSARIEYGDTIDAATLTPTASGTKYDGSFGRSIWLKGNQATLTWSDGTPQNCTAKSS